MNVFDKMANGWKICKISFNVLKANKSLIVFPIFSGISLFVILGLFIGGLISFTGFENLDANLDSIIEGDNLALRYGLIFLCYLVNYTVIVFFNMALIHCAKLYFEGEEVSVAKGIQFSMSRIGTILSWALFAATVGLVLKMIQDNLGWIGKMIISLIGFAWTVATFFSVPVLAYENVTPWDAVKRSAEIMKEKWGESLGATFSLGLIQFAAILLVIISAGLIGSVNQYVGMAIGILGVISIVIIFNALNSIFVSAVYNKINNNIAIEMDDAVLDNLFETK